MRAYVIRFCCLSGTLVAAVAGFNYVVDPYLTHQWDTPDVQRLRPPREKMSVWGKTYAVARYRPSILYIGNSRTELGVPTTLEVCRHVSACCARKGREEGVKASLAFLGFKSRSRNESVRVWKDGNPAGRTRTFSICHPRKRTNGTRDEIQTNAARRNFGVLSKRQETLHPQK